MAVFFQDIYLDTEVATTFLNEFKNNKNRNNYNSTNNNNNNNSKGIKSYWSLLQTVSLSIKITVTNAIVQKNWPDFNWTKFNVFTE